MENKVISVDKNNLNKLCKTARELIETHDYQKCETLICTAMGKYPHSPVLHNLFGILLEKRGEHNMAMKHFRAAWALDPTYIPARQNLDCYGTFFSYGKSSFDDGDCQLREKSEDSEDSSYKIEYDEHGIGRVVRRN
jgi:Tfp pilus assembly protein PilF